MEHKRIRDFFDERAATWDEGRPPESIPRVRDIVAGLNIASGSRVLDVGCGTGVLVPILEPMVGASGLLVELDVSREMLERAKAKAAASPCLCAQADAMDLPFAVECFDWILCYSVFPHFLDQRRGAMQLAQSLRPGGRLVVCHSQSREAINELHRSVGDVVGGHILPPENEMRALFRELGFEVTRIEDVPDRYVLVALKP